MICFFPPPFPQLLLSPDLYTETVNGHGLYNGQRMVPSSIQLPVQTPSTWSSYSAKLSFHAYLWIFIYNIILCVQPRFLLSFVPSFVPFVFCHCICNKGENSYELLPPGQKSWQGLVSSELLGKTWFRFRLHFDCRIAEYWWIEGVLLAAATGMTRGRGR